MYIDAWKHVFISDFSFKDFCGLITRYGTGLSEVSLCLVLADSITVKQLCKTSEGLSPNDEFKWGIHLF